MRTRKASSTTAALWISWGRLKVWRAPSCNDLVLHTNGCNDMVQTAHDVDSLVTSSWYMEHGTYMHLSGFTPTSDEVLYEQLLTTISSSWTFLFVFATPARVQQSFIRNIDIRANTAKGKWYKQKLLAQGQDSKYSPSCPSKQSEDPPNLTWEHAWRRTDVGLCMRISNLCRLQWMPQGSSTTTATISSSKTSGSL